MYAHSLSPVNMCCSEAVLQRGRVCVLPSSGVPGLHVRIHQQTLSWTSGGRGEPGLQARVLQSICYATRGVYKKNSDL